jgi:hypothetical protein
LTSEVANQLEADAPSDPAERLTCAVRAYFQVLFGGDEPQSWVNFLVRCSVDAPMPMTRFTRLRSARWKPR